MPTGPLGQCVDGVWTGDPMQLIGTSFIIPPQIIGNEHPETFVDLQTVDPAEMSMIVSNDFVHLQVPAFNRLVLTT